MHCCYCLYIRTSTSTSTHTHTHSQSSWDSWRIFCFRWISKRRGVLGAGLVCAHDPGAKTFFSGSALNDFAPRERGCYVAALPPHKKKKKRKENYSHTSYPYFLLFSSFSLSKWGKTINHDFIHVIAFFHASCDYLTSGSAAAVVPSGRHLFFFFLLFICCFLQLTLWCTTFRFFFFIFPSFFPLLAFVK